MALSNYELVRDRMRAAFTKYDQQKMIRKFSLPYDADYIYIDFVGRSHRINRQNGVVEWSLDGFKTCFEADHDQSMTIYDVLCYSKDDCALSGKYCPVSALKGTVGSAGPGRGIFKKHLADLQGNTEGLRRACRSLGHLIELNADVAALLYPFSFLPVILQYWEADDEFPANLKFMFDERILDYMHYETIFFMTGQLLARLKELMTGA